MLRCITTHAGVVSSTCSFLRTAFFSSVIDIPFSIPPTKAPFKPVRETTLVDSTLSMVGAVRAGLGLPFPFSYALHDELRSALVAELVHLGKDVVQQRAARRLALSVAKRMVRPLTTDLQKLVSDFARPINGHVDFGLIECMVRIFDWVQPELVDLLIRGF